MDTLSQGNTVPEVYFLVRISQKVLGLEMPGKSQGSHARTMWNAEGQDIAPAPEMLAASPGNGLKYHLLKNRIILPKQIQDTDTWNCQYAVS